MSASADVDAPQASRREQPFLYSWNRRLRHLHGVSLRNLNINPPNSRPRGKTITDDEYNLRTAAKSLVQKESRTIHHARSYDQLLKASAVEDRSPSPSRTSTHDVRKKSGPARPKGNVRRRSTLHWASSNPRMRQSKLEAVEVNRLVDSWFSIHHEDLEEPLYISEVMEQSMNSDFSFFDLSSSLTNVIRSDTFILRAWAKSQTLSEYRLLLELQVNLRSLQFIGRSLENFHHPLTENCVLLHLSDGIYTSFTDLPAEVQHQPEPTPAMKTMIPTHLAPFDALLKLSNLDDVIQDALKTRASLEADINQLLANMPYSERASSEVSSQREQSRNTRKACENEQKAIEHISTNTRDLQSALRSRRGVVRTGDERWMKLSGEYTELTNAVTKVQKDLNVLGEKSNAQVRRVCTSLMHIFPIEPVKNKTLQFSIRNIHLPNSSFSDTNSDEIAAALGYTAQLVYQLSLYLSIPLPYEIHPKESHSFIRDNVSAGIAQREYPLYPTGAVYKFEYAVFLLNKNIEFLMNRSGMRVMDIRHTLPNLKYLMFVLSAGTGDVPGRKVGGIRGLLRGRMTPSMSRKNSDDSVFSTLSDSKLSRQEKEKTGDLDDLLDTSFRSRGLPYRRSLMKDHG